MTISQSSDQAHDTNSRKRRPVPRLELTAFGRVNWLWLCEEAEIVGRYLLLWLIGVPIPILLLIWAFGGLH